MEEHHYIKVEEGASYHEVRLCCQAIKKCETIAWFIDIKEAQEYAQRKAAELNVKVKHVKE